MMVSISSLSICCCEWSLLQFSAALTAATTDAIVSQSSLDAELH